MFFFKITASLESLDELMEIVVPFFWDVRKKDVTVPYWSDPPYGPDQKMVCIVH